MEPLPMGNGLFPFTPAPPRASDRGAPSSSPSTQTCLGCGEAVDPLRAGHVAVLEGRFRYFCDAECKRSFLRGQGGPMPEDVATPRPAEVRLVPPISGRVGMEA